MDFLGRIDSLDEAVRAAKPAKYTAAFLSIAVFWFAIRGHFNLGGVIVSGILLLIAIGIHRMSRLAACFGFIFYGLIYLLSLHSRTPARIALGASILIMLFYGVLGAFAYRRLLSAQKEKPDNGFLPVPGASVLLGPDYKQELRARS